MASLADVGWKLLEFKARSNRSGSIYEPLKLSTLQRDDEPLWEKLDRYYNAVKTTILNYQSPTTGLFPVKTCSTCKEAKVRDSLYCAASAWALAMAHRRIDDDMGRTHELEHSAIKCMRGILYCYMRQADKLITQSSVRYGPVSNTYREHGISNGDVTRGHCWANVTEQIQQLGPTVVAWCLGTIF
ncbi:hypothetical protein FQN60_011297 [Etheostoma spectabile]|uniref:Phosphorylase b kinase regulatory subunit n=1 Tax=Etheostoma spectabile TaxID=54343 RepID=A0A5J5DRP3_9PERO|nr:hypothetical protein FQN60_011297 [Etheostoma spectabile]